MRLIVFLNGRVADDNIVLWWKLWWKLLITNCGEIISRRFEDHPVQNRVNRRTTQKVLSQTVHLLGR